MTVSAFVRNTLRFGSPFRPRQPSRKRSAKEQPPPPPPHPAVPQVPGFQEASHHILETSSAAMSHSQAAGTISHPSSVRSQVLPPFRSYGTEHHRSATTRRGGGNADTNSFFAEEDVPMSQLTMSQFSESQEGASVQSSQYSTGHNSQLHQRSVSHSSSRSTSNSDQVSAVGVSSQVPLYQTPSRAALVSLVPLPSKRKRPWTTNAFAWGTTPRRPTCVLSQTPPHKRIKMQQADPIAVRDKMDSHCVDDLEQREPAGAAPSHQQTSKITDHFKPIVKADPKSESVAQKEQALQKAISTQMERLGEQERRMVETFEGNKKLMDEKYEQLQEAHVKLAQTVSTLEDKATSLGDRLSSLDKRASSLFDEVSSFCTTAKQKVDASFRRALAEGTGSLQREVEAGVAKIHEILASAPATLLVDLRSKAAALFSRKGHPPVEKAIKAASNKEATQKETKKKSVIQPNETLSSPPSFTSTDSSDSSIVEEEIKTTRSTKASSLSKGKKSSVSTKKRAPGSTTEARRKQRRRLTYGTRSSHEKATNVTPCTKTSSRGSGIPPSVAVTRSKTFHPSSQTSSSPEALLLCGKSSRLDFSDFAATTWCSSRTGEAGSKRADARKKKSSTTTKATFRSGRKSRTTKKTKPTTTTNKTSHRRDNFSDENFSFLS